MQSEEDALALFDSGTNRNREGGDGKSPSPSTGEEKDVSVAIDMTSTMSIETAANITSNILLREHYIERLRVGLCSADGGQLQKRLLKSLDLMDMLRIVTLDVVEGIIEWRQGTQEPFTWKQTNYLLKIAHDCDFLDDIQPLVRWLGLSLRRNPLFTLSRRDREFAERSKLLLSSVKENRLRCVEDTLRREEISQGKTILGQTSSEFGGRKVQSPAQSTAGAPRELSPADILLHDRVRRKLFVLRTRPNSRKKIVRVSQNQGLKAHIKCEDFMRMIERNGIHLTESEEQWLFRCLDSEGTRSIPAKDILAYLETVQGPAIDTPASR